MDWRRNFDGAIGAAFVAAGVVFVLLALLGVVKFVELVGTL